MSIQTVVIQTCILLLTCLGSLALWYFYEPARLFWSKYFDIQLVSSITPNNSTGQFGLSDHFYIPQRLVVECLPIVGFGGGMYLFARAKNALFVFQKENNRRALLYLLIGLSGSLPMMISHKTSAFYLVPCLPFFALSFASWLEPTMIDWLEHFKISPQKTILVNRSMTFLAVSVAIYSFLQIGKIGRERNIIESMNILRGVIRDGEKICVCDSTMNDFNYHAYFQRYHRWELAKITDTTAHFFLETDRNCRISERDSALQKFKNKNIVGLKTFRLYEK